jgi:hypothetical protein
MASRANYVKIGLFVVLGLLSTFAIAGGLAASLLGRDKVAFFTYFNESVQGLDVGAPVTFRGVKIGKVADIKIAADRRTVEVRLDIDVGSVERLGIWPKGGNKSGNALAPPGADVRAQLGTQGLTGTNKFVSIDFFDPATHPPPELPFPVPDHYIPATKSFSKDLEDSVATALGRLTELAEVSLTAVGRVDRIAADLESAHLGEEAGQAVALAGAAMGELDGLIKEIHRAQIAKSAEATLESTRVVVGRLGKVIDRLDGDDGLVAATQRAVAALGDIGRNADGATRDLDETFAEIREAASAVRLLADELERQPDALLKGRSSRVSR